MKIFRLKSFLFFAAACVLFGSTWASAGNLPTWGGANTNQTQIQEPSKPLTSEPAANTAPTVKSTQPGTWTAPETTLSPGVSTPVQQQGTPPASSTPEVKPPAAGTGLTAPTWRTNVPTVQKPSTTLPSGRTSTSNTPAQQHNDPTPAATGRKGNFRVTINGFRVFATKGVMPRRGHTYYAAAKVMTYSQEGLLRSNTTRGTKLIGHTEKFPGALQGGTATRNGGFRNGDVYPSSPPYFAAQTTYTDRLPLKVWEGELKEGGDVVVIEAALWEKRNGASLFNAWRSYIPPKIKSLYPCFPRHWDLNTDVYRVPLPEWTGNYPNSIDDLISTPPPNGYRDLAVNRLKEGPRVCMESTPKELFRPTGRDEPDVIAGLTEKTFSVDSNNNYERGNVKVSTPYGILLNYAVAEKMANETRTEPVYAVDYYTNSISHGFISKNKRMETYLPIGGIQVSMFSRIPRDNQTMQISGANSAMVIPDWTVIELYIQVRRL